MPKTSFKLVKQETGSGNDLQHPWATPKAFKTTGSSITIFVILVHELTEQNMKNI